MPNGITGLGQFFSGAISGLGRAAVAGEEVVRERGLRRRLADIFQPGAEPGLEDIRSAFGQFGEPRDIFKIQSAIESQEQLQRRVSQEEEAETIRRTGLQRAEELFVEGKEPELEEAFGVIADFPHPDVINVVKTGLRVSRRKRETAAREERLERGVQIREQKAKQAEQTQKIKERGRWADGILKFVKEIDTINDKELRGITPDRPLLTIEEYTRGRISESDVNEAFKIKRERVPAVGEPERPIEEVQKTRQQRGRELKAEKSFDAITDINEKRKVAQEIVDILNREFPRGK